MAKLRCPKCGNDTFKISLTEKTVILDTLPPDNRRKIKIVEILHITCAKCGWNKRLIREK